MREGEGKAANNFYGRLAELLELDEREIDDFTHAYRRKGWDDRPTSEALWGALGDWLERLEGNRGLPTAYAAAHAHVGLPLSQALVRHTDRERLRDLFSNYGLAPHSTLASGEMSTLIDEWLCHVPCPASNSFERMWKRDDTARSRIVEVARLELESWDGVDGARLGNAEARVRDSIRLIATLRRFPQQQLTVALAVPARKGQIQATYELLDQADGVIGELDLESTTSGWLTTAGTSDLDVPSLLRGEVLLRESGSVGIARRRPRRLVPLRFDDLLQSFVETERLSLGEDFALLCRAEIEDQATQLLQRAARPGFRVHEALPGLPEGWVFIDGVQVLSSIPDDLLRGRLVDLNVLQPIASSQSVLQEGLRLPGNIRKWSSSRPPELRATDDTAASLIATIRVVRALASPEPEPRSRRSDQPVLIWNLADEHLVDGDYEITVTSDGQSVDRSMVLRLRSADNPAVQLEAGVKPAVHATSSSLYGLCAAADEDGDGFVTVPDESVTLNARPIEATITPGWFGARQTSTRSPSTEGRVRVPAPDPSSCMVTGGHYMLVEMARQGMTSVEGVCKTCGLVKRYPTRGRAKARRKNTARAAPIIDVVDLQPVPAPVTADWRIGFDAVCHMGRGTIGELLRIATQMESGEIFGDAFARRLEALGHIEVERNRTTLVPTSWQVVDPTLVGLSAGGWVLTGFRSERLLGALEDTLHALGIPMEVNESVEAPPVVWLGEMDEPQMGEVLESLSEASGRPARRVSDGAMRLAAVLPPLSRLIDNLPIATTFGGRSFERWNANTARFEPSHDASGAGAYRVSGFGRAYIYRRPEHIGAMSAMVGDARLVKYAAALDEKRGLLGYDVDRQILYVPLGANLPGLYGRAAVMASGRPPLDNLEERLLEYRKVPPALAGRLFEVLHS
jgi:hypothetical protein